MLALNQILRLGASGKNPIITSEAQLDLRLERAGYIGIELFVKLAPPPSPSHHPAWAGFHLKTLSWAEMHLV